MNTEKVRCIVGVEQKQGKYRLRLPAAIAVGSARYISTRLDVTPENFKKARRVAWEIEADINSGNLDVTLERYKQHFRPLLTLLPSGNKKSLTALELWDSYCDYMKPQLAETTYRRDYAKKYRNHIQNLPTQAINQAVAIREHLNSTLTANTTKRVLTYLSACCKWAVSSGLIQSNPFDGMPETIKLAKADVDNIDPFSQAERDTIIQAFQEHPSYKHYTNFVKFLFWTGCRTGEAIALQWKHIAQDCSHITFSESYDSALKVRKTTKTGKARRFPCNQVVQSILLSIRPDNPSPDDLVFTSPTGLIINNTRFTNQVWKGGRSGNKTYPGIVGTLAKEGKIERYRCPYNTRHTFITMAIEAGITVPQVAKLVGNSPEITMKHYAGNLLRLEIPVF